MLVEKERKERKNNIVIKGMNKNNFDNGGENKEG